MNLPHSKTRRPSLKVTAHAVWLTLGLLSTSPSAFAYDLWQAYQDAQQNDPVYLSSVAQKEAYDAQKSQARAAILPTVKLTGGIYKKRNSFLVNPKNAADTSTTPASLTVELRQPIFAFDKITGFKQVASNTEIGQLKLAQARQDLINRVVQAYFTAWLSERNTQIAQSVVIAAERQYQMAQKNFEVGNTTVIDTQEAQTMLHNAQATLISARGTADNARANLEFLVGHPIAESLSGVRGTLKLKMPVPSTVDSWVKRAQASNNNVKIAQLEYHFADLETTRMWQQRLPQVSIVANKKWNSTDYKGNSEEKTEAVNVGLELSMPIFDGGFISAQEREAEARKTISFQSLRATQNTVAQTTRAAYNQAVGGLATISALDAAQGAAQKSADSNLLGYQLGMRINVDVLNAQNTYAQAQYNLAQAQYNTILGNVNLKAAVGELSDDDVQYINALLSSSSKKTDK
jgi:outer membrane protein